MKQRFYVMVECKKKLEPKEILFALREARPNWGNVSASLAVQQGVETDVAYWHCKNCGAFQYKDFDICGDCNTPRGSR